MPTHVLPRLPWRLFQAEILGLEPGDLDPVTIIVAAQLRLRGHRRQTVATRESGRASDEVRRIVSARDSLLRQAVARVEGNTAGSPVPESAGMSRLRD